MSQPASSPTVRRPEIDGLRAVAAIWVMCDHFGLSALVGMHYGFLAVRLMLVLSAYFAAKQLRLLWASGPTPEPAGVASKVVHYYTSRVVRLGLLTYATIAIAFALDIPGARGTWQWHTLFATNLYITRFEEWPGALSHFWSLAVQMQFLLALPLLLLLIPRKWFWPLLACAVVASLGHRISVIHAGASEFQRWMPLANSIDAFAFGIALAWVEKERPQWFRRLGQPWVWGSALLLLAAMFPMRSLYYHGPLGIITETGEALALMLLFGALVGGFTFGLVGRFLRHKAVVFLGGASLSIYALHPIAEQSLGRLWRMLELDIHLSSHLPFQLAAVAFALLVAWVAFHLLEIPARRLAVAVEPRLIQWLTSLAQRDWRTAGARFQPVAACFICAALFYGASAPLRPPAPALHDEGAPVAIETLEEMMEEIPSDLGDPEEMMPVEDRLPGQFV